MTDEFVFELLDKFNDSEVVDLSFSRDDTCITLRKKEACVIPAEKKTVHSDSSEKVEVITKSVEKQVFEKEKLPETEKKTTSESEELKSPVVGTFYRSPSPDSPAYAEKGKKISKGEPLCIIEAMKLMNTLNAEFDMEIVDVLVENGELVEFDQPLFAVNRL